MSSSFMNENDLVRLGEEAKLTEDTPLVLPEEPASIEPEQELPGIALIKAIAAMFTDRGIT